MTASRSRFPTPRGRVPAEAAWALDQAFAAEPRLAPPADEAAVLRVARALDLGPRIAWRRIPGPGDRLRADQGVVALAADGLQETARAMADHGPPIALLKGVALIARGVVTPGARPLADLDVLVRERDLAGAAQALRCAGYRPAEGSVPSEHQLSPLVKDGRSVELHRFLPGVRVPGAPGFATFEALDAAGLLEPVPGWPAGVRVPVPAVLAAHAAVHGIAQHGWAPRSYPLTRMLGDLIDLRVQADAGLAAAAHALVAAEVPAAEWQDLLETLRALEAGRGQQRPLVVHAVLGLLDDDYAASLKLRSLGAGPSTLPRPFVIVRDAWRAVFPGQERLAALDPSGRARALKRPFAMLGRGLGALWRSRA